MQPILDKLKENIQVIYRRAVDADAMLAKLHQQGQGKFQQIFPEDAGFAVSSKRFGPYVEELAKQVIALETCDSQTEFEQQLPDVVKKMELLFSTLGNLQASLRG